MKRKLECFFFNFKLNFICLIKLFNIFELLNTGITIDKCIVIKIQIKLSL